MGDGSGKQTFVGEAGEEVTPCGHRDVCWGHEFVGGLSGVLPHTCRRNVLGTEPINYKRI